jgi:hypothetical protein
MHALAYLLGVRAIEASRADRRPTTEAPDESLPPMATTDETAAAWRRWRDAAAQVSVPAPQGQPRTVPRVAS